MQPFTCPHCGSTDVRFEEFVIASRFLVGLNADGTLIIEGEIDSYSDEGKDERLWCATCTKHTPIPDQIDFA